MVGNRKLHPVSLHVIRGAVEYCGWKFGKIEQISLEVDAYFAEYECIIEKMPAGLEKQSWAVISRQLQHCFAADITLSNLWRSKGGTYRCQLIVKFGNHPDLLQDTLWANSEPA